MERTRRAACAALAVVAIAGAAAGAAEAASPGRNGMITYTGPSPDGSPYGAIWRTGDTPRVVMQDAVSGGSWSPDGKRLAFSLYTGPAGTQLASVGAGRLGAAPLGWSSYTQLTSGPPEPAGSWGGPRFVDFEEPSFAPDSKKLVFARKPDAWGTAGLYVRGADGTLRRLTSSGDDGSPAWSPDGGLVAFTRCAASCSLLAVTPTGGSPRTLATGVLRHPDWSPDARRVVYERVPQGGAGTGGIWLVGRGGAGDRQLLPWGSTPAYSPDGKKIAFAADDGMYVMDADGTRVRRVSTQPGLDPSWQPLR
jgi:TolB protein